MIADFEIIPGKEFLNRFLDKRDMFLLSPAMVEKLRGSNDPCGKYGYGRWLYVTAPENKENLCIVRDCIEFAAESGIPDAVYMLSRLYYYGNYIDKESGIMLLDRKKAGELLAKAKSKGSELAKLQICDDEFFTACRLKKSVAPVMRKIKREVAKPGASLLWKELQGWVYEHMGKNDEAITLYEECVEGGLLHCIPWLACNYYSRGNIAYYESLMEEGIEKEVPSCFTLGIEEESNWEKYDDEARVEIHRQLDINLRRGSELGCVTCTCYLAKYLHKGLMGYERDDIEAMKYARKGIDRGDIECCKIAFDIFWWCSGILPEEMNLTKEEALMMRLRALRYASDAEAWSIMHDYVLDYRKELQKMGYADELNYWKDFCGIPARYFEDEDDDGACEDETAINPMVLVIHPSGLTDFVDTESKELSYTSLMELIDADGCDAVHYSAALDRITKDCGLGKNVAFYVDRNAIAKDLPDNAVATMLYGHGYEIRGAIVVALEDKKYSTRSFNSEEDAEAVFDAINEFTGGLLRREAPDDDGRNDAWA